MQRAVAIGGLSVPVLALTAGLAITPASAHGLAPARAAAATPAAPAPTAAVCPSAADLGAASGYNEFAFGDANRGLAQGDDDEGDVAYGGNATFTGDFYVGTYTGDKDAAVIGGNVTGEIVPQSGSTGIYGGTISQPTANMTQGQPPFSFSQTAQQITAKSATWGADVQTAGATAVLDGSSLYLTGTDPTFNAFDLSAGEFAASQTIFIDVPVGSTVLVNVPDTDLSTTTLQDVQYWDGSYYESGSQYNSAAVDTIRNSTLFNFPNATTLTFQNAQLPGTFVAPKADFTFSSGQVDGNIIANEINGEYEGEFDPAFVGCTPTTPPAATPEVGDVVALPAVAAVLVGGAVIIKRRRSRRSTPAV